MKYQSVNELDAFAFHDAFINDLDFSTDNMVWRISDLNATVNNSQNNGDTDLCISSARMTLQNAKISEIKFSGYSIYNDKNELLEKVDERIADEAEYAEIIQKTSQKGKTSWAFFQGLEKTGMHGDKFYAQFLIDSTAGYFYMTVEFDRAEVVWDRFSGLAWYEKPPFKNDSKETE